MQQFVALNVEELLWLRLDGKHVGKGVGQTGMRSKQRACATFIYLQHPAVILSMHFNLHPFVILLLCSARNIEHIKSAREKSFFFRYDFEKILLTYITWLHIRCVVFSHKSGVSFAM